MAQEVAPVHPTGNQLIEDRVFERRGSPSEPVEITGHAETINKKGAPPKQRAGTDIAFAASLLVRPDAIYLYYSLEDRLLRRALIGRLRPM